MVYAPFPATVVSERRNVYFKIPTYLSFLYYYFSSNTYIEYKKKFLDT